MQKVEVHFRKCKRVGSEVEQHRQTWSCNRWKKCCLGLKPIELNARACCLYDLIGIERRLDRVGVRKVTWCPSCAQTGGRRLARVNENSDAGRPN